MAKRISNFLEDNLWELLDAHPDFIFLSRADQRWAFEELRDLIFHADPLEPLSFEAASASLDRIFTELGLLPLDEAKDRDVILTETRVRELYNDLNIFKAQPERERLVDKGISNPDVSPNLQLNAFRTGWDLALQYAQGRIFEIFELSGNGNRNVAPLSIEVDEKSELS